MMNSRGALRGLACVQGARVVNLQNDTCVFAYGTSCLFIRCVSLWGSLSHQHHLSGVTLTSLRWFRAPYTAFERICQDAPLAFRNTL